MPHLHPSYVSAVGARTISSSSHHGTLALDSDALATVLFELPSGDVQR